MTSTVNKEIRERHYQFNGPSQITIPNVEINYSIDLNMPLQMFGLINIFDEGKGRKKKNPVIVKKSQKVWKFQAFPEEDAMKSFCANTSSPRPNSILHKSKIISTMTPMLKQLPKLSPYLSLFSLAWEWTNPTFTTCLDTSILQWQNYDFHLFEVKHSKVKQNCIYFSNNKNISYNDKKLCTKINVSVFISTRIIFHTRAELSNVILPDSNLKPNNIGKNFDHNCYWLIISKSTSL